MKSKRLPILVTILLLASFAAVGQQALEPSPSRLQQDISYLASDALDGRRTGTAGANDAARYIAGEFLRAGLRPGISATGDEKRRQRMARYLQTFPYVGRVELGQGNVFSIRSGETVVDLGVGEDWMPLGISANQTLDFTEAVFAGYGITANAINYNDYKGTYSKNQIAIINSGTPDGDSPHTRFGSAGELRFRIAAAESAGVGALLILSREDDLKNDPLAQLTYDNAGSAGIPVAVISKQAGWKIVKVVEARDTVTIDTSPRSEAERRMRESTSMGVRDTMRVERPRPFKLTLTTDVVRKEVPTYNVIGVLEGSDPVLKNENIIIGAHYDHLGRGGEGSLAPKAGEIHHGADDNASGTAGLIELARLFSVQRPKLKRTLIFIAFGGEEEGLLGSNYYVNHPLTPLTNTVGMINMDMIGRMKDRKLIIGGVGTAKEWRGLIEPEKSFELSLNEDGFGPSDHSSFYGKQVPVLFFWTGTHNDYHKPSDTSDKINYNDEAKILSFIARIVRDIDSADKRLTYTTAKSNPGIPSSGFRVYLGTIPNYGESTNGLLIDGVRDGSPAAKAGLKAGDRIVKINDGDIRNIYDYTYALSEMKAGQEYVFEVVRGGERFKLRVAPEARK